MKNFKNNLKESKKIAVFYTSKANWAGETKKEFKHFTTGMRGINVYFWFEDLDKVIERTGIDYDGFYKLDFDVYDNSCTWDDEGKKLFDSLELKDLETGELITHEDLGEAVVIDERRKLVLPSEEYDANEELLATDVKAGEPDANYWSSLWKLSQEEVELVLKTEGESYLFEAGVCDDYKKLLEMFDTGDQAEMIINTELNLAQMIKQNYIVETNAEEDAAVEINGKFYKKKMPKTKIMKVEELRKVLLFLYNKNIDVVEDIYKGKVGEGMLNHLISKAENYAQTYNNNTRAWMEFILHLDLENSLILIDHLFPEKNGQIDLIEQIEEIKREELKGMHLLGKGDYTFSERETYGKGEE